MKIPITISCCLCPATYETEIALPSKWKLRYDGIGEELGFCSQHSPIKGWTDTQCSDCVGGWGECDLWRSFAYRKKDLTEDDFAQIANGICPKRTNGFFVVEDGETESLNLATRATKESGLALAAAIRQYWARYQD